MEKQFHHFDLIRNTYLPEVARELLQCLVNEKIEFLERTISGLESTQGMDANYHQNRVDQLKEEQQRLMEFLKQLDDANCEVDISCPVSIYVRKNEESKSDQTTVKA